MQFLEDEVEEHKKELFEYQKELDKSNQSKKDLRNDAEIACVECDKLNRKMVCVCGIQMQCINRKDKK